MSRSTNRGLLAKKLSESEGKDRQPEQDVSCGSRTSKFSAESPRRSNSANARIFLKRKQNELLQRTQRS